MRFWTRASRCLRPAASSSGATALTRSRRTFALAIALVTYVAGRTLAMVVAQIAPTPRSPAESAITWHLIHVLDKLERGVQ